MPPLKDLVAKYVQLFEAGNNLEIIDTFYAANIIQIENSEASIVGKHILRINEQTNLARIVGLEQQITTVLIDEEQGLVMGEMHINFTSKKSGKKVLNEAFLQKWSGEFIIFQRFYYGPILTASSNSG